MFIYKYINILTCPEKSLFRRCIKGRGTEAIYITGKITKITLAVAITLCIAFSFIPVAIAAENTELVNNNINEEITGQSTTNMATSRISYRLYRRAYATQSRAGTDRRRRVNNAGTDRRRRVNNAGTDRRRVRRVRRVRRARRARAGRVNSARARTSNSAKWTSSPTISSIMRSGARFPWRRGISTAAAMQRVGAGDCWAMSEYLHSRFQAAGYNSRIIQYATSLSPRHRSVQLNQNGEWITVPYRAYGFDRLFV